MNLPVRTLNRFRALLLILLAIFLMQKMVSGQIGLYTSPRFGWLTYIGAALLIALAWGYDLFRQGGVEDHEHEHEHEHDHDHDHGSGKGALTALGLVALPLILGVIVPPQPLSTSAIASRGINTNIVSRADEGATVLSIVPSERNVLDWVRAMSSDPRPEALDGQQADLIGFVYRDPRFSENQIMVARFSMSCCVADALAIGVVVETPHASRFGVDSWVHVTGTFEAGELSGEGLPVLIVATIEQIEQPEQPYLFQ